MVNRYQRLANINYCSASTKAADINFRNLCLIEFLLELNFRTWRVGLLAALLLTKLILIPPPVKMKLFSPSSTSLLT